MLDSVETKLARHVGPIAKRWRDLAKVMGPIARVLVKRALDSAGSAQALRAALAVHIEKPADRAAFFKRS